MIVLFTVGMFDFQFGPSGQQGEGASSGDDGGYAVFKHDVRQGAAERHFQYGTEDCDR